MSKSFIHYEGDPSFTLKLWSDQNDFKTVADATEHFISKYNAKFPENTLSLEEVGIKLGLRAAKPFNKTSDASQLFKYEDLYIVKIQSSTASSLLSTATQAVNKTEDSKSSSQDSSNDSFKHSQLSIQGQNTKESSSSNKSVPSTSSSTASTQTTATPSTATSHPPMKPGSPQSSQSTTSASQSTSSNHQTPTIHTTTDVLECGDFDTFGAQEMKNLELGQSRSLEFRRMGNDKMNQSKSVEAKAAYSMGIQQYSADPLLWSNRSQANLNLNDYQSAIDDTDYALVLDPKNTKALFRRAQGLIGKDPTDSVDAYLSLYVMDRVIFLSQQDSSFNDASKSNLKTQRQKIFETLQSSCTDKNSHEQFLAAQASSNDQLKNFFNEPLRTAQQAMDAEQYQHALGIYHQVVHLVPSHPAALKNLGILWLRAGKYQKSLFNFVNLITLNDLDKKQMLEINEWILKCLWPLKQYRIACSISVSSLIYATGSSKFLKESTLRGNVNQQHKQQIFNTRATFAKGLRLLGCPHMCRSLLIANLQIDQDHIPSLDEYGRIMEYFEMPVEALRVYLKMLVIDMHNPSLKEHLADVLPKPEAFKFLREQLDVSERPDQFYAYMASGVKEFGAVQTAVDLYKACLEFKPNHPSYTLNMIHDMEVLNQYAEAFTIIKSFIFHLKDQYIGPVHMAAVWNIIRHIDDIYDYQIWKTPPSSNGSKAVPELPTKPGKVDLSVAYSPADLDRLATLFTLVKILYVNGVLAVLPSLCELTETACEGREIHETSIKNENAYFSCISGIMKYHTSLIQNPPNESVPRLYVAGDSHCLAPAWSTLTFRGKPHFVTPLLVTGMKIWHLRPQSRFFPKNNFYNVVPKAPPKSSIIFLFGEIDCREGFLVSVQKCRYKDMDEAAQFTINIYMDILKSLVEQYQYEIFIHPIVPVLDATRHVVIPFMKLLVKTIESVKSNSSPGDWTHNIHMLDFFWKLVKEWNPEKEPRPEYWGAPPKVNWYFEKEYDLDLTHMNPKYLKLLQPALTVAEMEADSDPNPFVPKSA